jgi:serine/threonine-protein kinase
MLMASDTQAFLPETDHGVLVPGRVVGGRYELVRELGRGASGVVWQASHALLASEVAVKFLDTFDDHTRDVRVLVERFRFEAQVSARLGRRTNRIVSVHDGATFHGIPYIVMDLVEGESLEATLERGPLPVDELAGVVRDVAAALEACHEEGIAHRDVKPGNILAVRSGSSVGFKLADFGVAKLFGSAPKGLVPPGATAEHVLVGSPAYMSPEAISGDQTLSGALDTWALAVTAYECLTQRLPFPGDEWPAVAVSVVAGRYLPPSSVLGPDASAFDPVFGRAFARRVEDRFQSPRELSDAVEAAVLEQRANRTKARAGPAAFPLEEARLPLQKARGRGAALVAGLVAFLLVGGLLVWRGSDDPALPDAAAATPTLATQARPSPAPSASTEPVVPVGGIDAVERDAPAFSAAPERSTATLGRATVRTTGARAQPTTGSVRSEVHASRPLATVDPSETQ